MQVSAMQRELEELQPQLLKMAGENVQMMQNIDSQSQEMEYNSEVVRAEEVVAKRQAAAAQALKDECEAELAEAVPALEAAIAALNTLKVRHRTCISYFKSEIDKLRKNTYGLRHRLIRVALGLHGWLYLLMRLQKVSFYGILFVSLL